MMVWGCVDEITNSALYQKSPEENVRQAGFDIIKLFGLCSRTMTLGMTS